MSMPPLAVSVSQGAQDPTPIEPPVPTPEAPPAGPPAPEGAPGEGDDDEPTTPPQPGEPERPKRRLVDDLRTERQQRKQLEAEAAQLRLQQQQMQPLLEAVFTNPSVMTLLTQQQHGQPGPDPELHDLAQSLGLYTAQGQPDLQAASRVLGFVDRRAQAHAQQIVAPVQQHSIQQQAQAVRQQALAVGTDAGIRADTLDRVIGLLPPELLVQPNVAALAVAVAAGVERMQGGGYAPPLLTEGVGGRPRGTALPTALQNVLKSRGLNEKDIQSSTTKFQPGGFNPLE